MKRTRTGGFSLIELLVVVGIVGILAAIAIVNYRMGIERAKQKRTMSDMRTIAIAFEARATDVHGYNAAGAASGWSMPANTLSQAQVDGLLAPTYLKTIPRVDGWNRPYGFSLDEPVGGLDANVYAIRSAGSDGVFDGTSYTPGTTTDFDCDIVYSNGNFISYPTPH